jgi:hypothetical protein
VAEGQMSRCPPGDIDSIGVGEYRWVGAGVVANIAIARELAGWCLSPATLTSPSEPGLDRPRFGQRPGMVNFAMQWCRTRNYEADDYVGNLARDSSCAPAADNS